VTETPSPAAFAARPPSEVEWEELLVRIEVTARALRFAVEDAPAGHPAVLESLRRAFTWEVALRSALERMRGAAEAYAPPGMDTPPADTAEAVRWIAQLRARNFAMVQRRGIDVWDWRVEGEPFHGATPYQLLLATAAQDSRTLAGVRGAGRGG
jgi:hypothetical protein